MTVPESGEPAGAPRDGPVDPGLNVEARAHRRRGVSTDEGRPAGRHARPDAWPWWKKAVAYPARLLGKALSFLIP
jgi:hypothetical protein